MTTNWPLPQQDKPAPCRERWCWAGRVWKLDLALAPQPAGFSGTSAPLYTLHCPPAKYWLLVVPCRAKERKCIRVTLTFLVFSTCHINLSQCKEGAILLWIHIIKLAVVCKNINLVNMLRKVWIICPVNATPIWTRNAWNSVKKKASISSVTSRKEKKTRIKINLWF